MTSCRVAENLKYGPLQTHTITIASVERNAQGEPAPSARLRASFQNTSAGELFALICPPIKDEADDWFSRPHRRYGQIGLQETLARYRPFFCDRSE
jgi:hypothetical protein